MFFQDHQKKIYKPSWCETGLDPLRTENLLVYHSAGQFYKWLGDYNATTLPPGDPNEGDVSPQGKAEKLRLGAIAELELARVSKEVLRLEGENVEGILDAIALERLFEFTEYLEKKGYPAGT